MPTLQPQIVSGLVVTPTVEHDPGIWRVSIAIDVGQSRTPPAQVVSREDLVVELKNPSEGSLEAIASPDPGPLLTRALRVVQARAEYTFAQGVNDATELVVNLRSDRKSFPLAQTLRPTRCLGREPKEGDRFPGPPSRGGILSRIPILRPLKRARCCVRKYDAPSSVSNDPAEKSELFSVAALFSGRGGKCRCSCCEYRQYVRGTFTDANGAAVRFDMPSGALSDTTYCEDGSIDEFGPGRHGFYGHRDTSSAGDEYTGTGPDKGCSYLGSEKSACPPADTAHLEFLGLIVDRCQGRVVAVKTWTVDL